MFHGKREKRERKTMQCNVHYKLRTLYPNVEKPNSDGIASMRTMHSVHDNMHSISLARKYVSRSVKSWRFISSCYFTFEPLAHTHTYLSSRDREMFERRKHRTNTDQTKLETTLSGCIVMVGQMHSKKTTGFRSYHPIALFVCFGCELVCCFGGHVFNLFGIWSNFQSICAASIRCVYTNLKAIEVLWHDLLPWEHSAQADYNAPLK